MKTYIEDRSIPEPNSGCWLWLLSAGSHGYGQGWTGTHNVLAHRMAQTAYNGPIPEGYEVDHLCRNKLCVNPDHLEAVSPEENERRMCLANNKQWEATAEERRKGQRLRKTAWQREHRKRKREGTTNEIARFERGHPEGNTGGANPAG